MEDDFYQTSKTTENEGNEDVGPETFLAPKSAFAGKELKVGNKCEVEIKSLMDDEVELAYVPHESKKEEGREVPDEAQASMDRGIEKMRRGGMGMMEGA
jgi:hypothetical protein